MRLETVQRAAQAVVDARAPSQRKTGPASLPTKDFFSNTLSVVEHAVLAAQAVVDKDQAWSRLMDMSELSTVSTECPSGQSSPRLTPENSIQCQERRFTAVMPCDRAKARMSSAYVASDTLHGAASPKPRSRVDCRSARARSDVDGSRDQGLRSSAACRRLAGQKSLLSNRQAASASTASPTQVGMIGLTNFAPPATSSRASALATARALHKQRRSEDKNATISDTLAEVRRELSGL